MADFVKTSLPLVPRLFYGLWLMNTLNIVSWVGSNSQTLACRAIALPLSYQSGKRTLMV